MGFVFAWRRISRRAVFLGLAVSPTLLAAPAMAQANAGVRPAGSQHTRVYQTSLDAGGDAAEYSRARNTIGVVVYFARGLVEPVSYGDAFAQSLIRQGVNARSFAAPVGGTGVTVLYQVGPSGIGPFEINDPAANRANMQRAIELSQARDRVLSPGYVPPRS